MKPLGGYWLVHNKYRFLLAVMEELAGNAHIAFVGDFSGLEIMKAAGIPEEKTPLLERRTSSPKLDSVVLPLESSTAKSVLRLFGRIGFQRRKALRRIVHVQIEKGGRLEFAAYDNFDAGIYFGPAIPWKLLENLTSRGILTRTDRYLGRYLN
jgi:hypothetical protein